MEYETKVIYCGSCKITIKKPVLTETQQKKSDAEKGKRLGRILATINS